jgi:hypothetical protein
LMYEHCCHCQFAFENLRGLGPPIKFGESN